ncbi:MBL fold metallo-hydrolase [Mycobacterium sp. CBMA293]|uniref:MBL fold metallo-hydrolase n=1 Tax=unclassified Mycolicibacterium TaxID=2636767 RepID=UPI0012DF8F02|nr:MULTISPECIES: MBL fold metallo-hydrolase [unclassified Mycolicibacterium]MUL44414.1 MBL fold metallo-hydrolase [Mycolicibacterium sp. CBMA 360]MUL59734.1 MBL fold metallo-hydrolase [Mycolicibacterium sp. CBMA 335]MUL68577.1 MBL fold metallo-hydrolase [Mycolicibacterium sp. CBMA 311]MUL94032.1 MBL fold metallo-hydrolase [Mycolicibacterium sp. CBMA 230]MUM06278.1 MBL fold metallo-hydrolase [Mycolicibacterium sp. CBMA 213]
MAAALSAITDNIHFAQTDLVNWTLISDGSGVMLIDAGFPGQRDDVLGSLRQLGFDAGDVRAILLTHAHVDHFGTAIWFAKTHGTPVYCHSTEVGHAKREYLEQVSPTDLLARAWNPRYLTWSLTIVGKGALVREGIPTAQALTEDVAATLPGSPHLIPSPGHTGGHCSYVFGDVLVAGDAVITGHPVSTKRGPQLLPKMFNHDQGTAERSVAALALLDTQVLLPGHGPVWRGPVRDITELALPRS